MKLMKTLLPRLLAEFPFIDTRSATESDFYAACERHSIEVISTPDIRNGLYVKMRDRQFIFLNNKLRGLRMLRVAFHELAHALFHSPSRSVVAEFFDIHYRRRHEFEADAVTALLLVPLAYASEYLRDGENPNSYEIADLIRIRIEIHNRYYHLFKPKHD